MALGWKLALLGMNVSGDIAGMTIYTDRYARKNWFVNAPPNKPRSAKQVWHSQRFAAAVLTWKGLSDADKATLELATRRTSLCATGQNLWVSCVLRGADGVYATVGRQAGLALPPLAELPR